MSKSICGIDCTKCELSNTCQGCTQTDGHPFGRACVIAPYCRKGEAALKEFKDRLLEAFHSLPIAELQEVQDLNPLKGSFINLEYTLPSARTVKFWDDNKIYLGNQICRKGSGRCYGLAADDRYLMVCEYGDLGADPELVAFMRWNETQEFCKEDTK